MAIKFHGINRPELPIGFFRLGHASHRVSVFGLHGSTLVSPLGCSFGSVTAGIASYLQYPGTHVSYTKFSELCRLVTRRQFKAYGVIRGGTKTGLVHLTQRGWDIHEFSIFQDQVLLNPKTKYRTFKSAVANLRHKGNKVLTFPSFADLVAWLEQTS